MRAEARTLTGTVPGAGDIAIEITAADPLGSTCSDELTIRASGGRQLP